MHSFISLPRPSLSHVADLFARESRTQSGRVSWKIVKRIAAMSLTFVSYGRYKEYGEGDAVRGKINRKLAERKREREKA
jgi:hypothetical protein